VPSEDSPVAADHKQAVEQVPVRRIPLRRADEADDPEVGAQLGESAHPDAGLRIDPIRADAALEAIARHHQLAGDDPLGAEFGRHARPGLDQRAIAVEPAELGCEMQ